MFPILDPFVVRNFVTYSAFADKARAAHFAGYPEATRLYRSARNNYAKRLIRYAQLQGWLPSL